MFERSKIIVLISCYALMACSSQKEEHPKYSLNTDIDMSIFKDDKLLSIDGYKIDSSARVYVLNECSKIVKKGENTPTHCLNAAEAEVAILFEDLKQNVQDRVADPIDEHGLNEIKKDIVNTYTFIKL